jgi:H+/Cl- antiporter ClcA/CBS domain-containing protein
MATVAKGEAHEEDRLADFTRDRRVLLLSAMALVVGAASAVVAQVLVWLIAVITNFAYFQTYSSVFQSPEGNHLGWLAVFVPAIGGLIIGLMARYGSEKIRGHGIPEALEAILFGRSRMEPKVAVLKPLSSAISIGTGGPFGAEGPIIMTGGAFGSLFAQMFNMSSAERKTLLVAGAAGGMSAIFASPIAAVLLAVELLLFEWRPRSFIPVALSAAMAYALRIPLLGSGPIFPIPPHGIQGAETLAFALLVGVIAGFGSGILTKLVYAFEDLFDKLPIHWMWWPTLGGLCVGIGGLIEPRVIGVGYDTIHDLLRGNIVGAALIGIIIGKSLVWTISLGSGTSGGVLAPLLMMGGALGAAEAAFLPIGDVGMWATVSMAAIMGGTMRSPLTSMIFALELTQDLNLLPSLMVACVAAHAVTVLVLRRSILTEKVVRRGYHITREYSVDPLASVRVGEVMDKGAPVIAATTKVSELAARIARHDPQVTRHQALPIVDEGGRLVGIITRGDIVRSMERAADAEATVLEAGTRTLVIVFPDESLQEAATRMLRNNIGRLLVVARNDGQKMLGYLGRSNLMEARLRQVDEEHVKERGRGKRSKTSIAGSA